MTSPYETAKSYGYSDQEILYHLESHPHYSEKIKTAKSHGYSDDEISRFLSLQQKNPENEDKQKKSNLMQAGRAAGQYALGAIQGSAPGLVYEAAISPLASEGAQFTANRENIFADIEQLAEKKQFGQDITGKWNEKDQELLDHLTNLIKHPEESEKYIKTADLSIPTLVEKATGINTKPEGWLEKAANWAGFIKGNAKDLIKTGMKPSELIKAISPSASEITRGAGAGLALEMAEQGNFGPIGTIGAAIVGDLIGSGVSGIGKAIVKPKETIAKNIAKLTSNEKSDIQKSIIKDFRDAGIQADVGTLTDSNLVKSVQARLSQSGLTGRPLEELRNKLTSDIKEEYKKLADELGEFRFQTMHEASETGKEYLTHIRDAERHRISELYSKANKRLKDDSVINPAKLSFAISKIEKSLAPGSIKSTEQKAVLEILEKLKSDIYNIEGDLKSSSVKDLINNKIALNDIINYEIQGGQKQLLKGLVHELDEAIQSYGVHDQEFLRNYLSANKEFSEHAKTFRNQNINRVLTSQDPSIFMNKMNTVQGVREIEKALSIHPEGKKLFGDLKRYKFDQMIGNKMTDNVSEQLKSGTFANLLKNPKDQQIIKEILGDKAFAKLAKLQKISGKLAQTAQKFMNTSQSGVSIIDVGIIAKAFADMSYILSGNPWPFLKTAAGFAGAKYIASLMGNAEFLKLVEEAILAAEKNETSNLLRIGAKLEEPIRAALSQSQSQ